ncbi:MAG: outer membrane beta-barrel protein, partial [Kofleriaceae bacterium]
RLFFPADNVGSGTLTADVRPADNLSVRVEYRYDRGDADMFFEGRVEPDPTTGIAPPNAQSQQTLTLGAVTWF